MECANRGRATAAADGVVDGGRRFPDPPQPRGNRDADRAPVDLAALALRRVTLLQELHKERIRQEMILCELAETEHAMAMLPCPPGDRLSSPAAGWEPWRCRPPMPTLEEKPYYAPRSSEQPSWWRRSPSEPLIVPVYPHVERSPSPVLQPQPADDAEQHGRGSSSRPLAEAPSACPDGKECRSSSKEPAVQEALVPAAINAAAKPMEPALFSEEVTPQSCADVGLEREAGSKDGHAVQLMKSAIQRSEQPKRAAAVGEEREAEAKDSHAVQLVEESRIQSSEQPKPAEPTIEDRIDKRVQSPCQYTLADKEKSPSDEQKRLDLNEPKIQITPCGVRRGMPALTSLIKRNRLLGERSCICTLCRVSLTCEEKLAQHREGQPHQSNLAALQSRQKAARLITTTSTPESSHGAQRQNAQSLHHNGDKNMENTESLEAKCAPGFDLRNHLNVRRHQQNTQALHGEEGNNNEGRKRAADRMGEGQAEKFVNKRRLHFCELCKVQCNSEKMMESHLGGKKHRGMLQGRH